MGVETRKAKANKEPLTALVDYAETKDFDLPADLSEKHDQYLHGTNKN